MFPNAVFAFTPEGVQFYQDLPVSPRPDPVVTGRRLPPPRRDPRQQRLARYLAYRIDRETSAEDQQLSIWSNESMKSTAFDDFHLSDLEYGVRSHHDQLRQPASGLDAPARAPPEGTSQAVNEELLRIDGQSGT